MENRMKDDPMVKTGLKVIDMLVESGLGYVEQVELLDMLKDALMRFVVLKAVLGEDAEKFAEFLIAQGYEEVIKQAEEAINGD